MQFAGVHVSIKSKRKYISTGDISKVLSKLDS